MNMESLRETILDELLKRGGGMQHMLDIACEMLGNPIVMIDLSYNLLAKTDIRVSDDPLWNELTTLGTFSHETVDFFNTEQFIDMYDKADTVALMKSDKLKYDRADGKLFNSDGIQIGSIVVVACHAPFKDEDFDLIEVLCEFLSIELQQSEIGKSIRHAFEDTFISHLIEGQETDRVQTERQIKEFCLGLKANLYVAVVDIIQYDPTLTHLVYFKDLFERMQGGHKYLAYLNNIIIIASTDKPTLNIEKDFGGLSGFFKKYNIFAGISHSFQNLFEIRKYYRQALNALNYGMENSDQHIFKYDDCMVDYMLSCVKDFKEMQDFFSTVVTQVQEYDKKHGTNYLTILQTYLLFGRNRQITANKLNMDYDTLCHLLQEIEEIFEIDWDNGNMILSIFISLKMLECFPT